MRKVKVVKAEKVKVKPLKLSRFSIAETRCVSEKPVTKKVLKAVAKRLKLPYDEKQIAFTQKLMNAYMKREGL